MDRSLESQARRQLTPSKSHPRDPVRQNYLDADGHMFPGAEVVARPHCAEALRAGVERTGENEGTGGRAGTSPDSLRGLVGLSNLSVRVVKW